MATASPTPMGSSHFASRRPASRQAYMQPPSRPQLSRGESVPVETHARTYSLNDSSDDDIPVPMMRFSAITNAILDDAAPSVNQYQSPPKLAYTARTTPSPDAHDRYHSRAGSISTIRDRVSPPGSRVHSPYPQKRTVRLSRTPPGTSSKLRRSTSLASAAPKYNAQEAPRAESPLDLSTPSPAPRTVRLPFNSSRNHEQSAGSSGKLSNRTNSASRDEDGEVGSQEQEYPTTVGRSQFATSQGSVSRYGQSTIGRSRYGEDIGSQSTMRATGVAKIKGAFMKGPARRGRRRISDEEPSPVEEQGDGLDVAGSSQEPQNQESQGPESQSQDPGSSQEPEAKSLFSSNYRDFAASGSPVSSKDAVNSVLRSRSPPPPTLSSSQRSKALDSNGRVAQENVQPVFKVPGTRPDLPSAHDQENEAPPTFKRNKQAPLLDKMEKVLIRTEAKSLARPESMDMESALRTASPERRPLAPRSQNTPRRPAPPPPKMSILDAATSTAGAATAAHAGGKRNRLKVNGKQFTRLDCIGRGGSSRVYRVMAENSKFFALKRVNLDDADEMAVRGFKGEIDLLRKLEDVERVIRLYDYELNEDKGTLSVVSNVDQVYINFADDYSLWKWENWI